VSTQTHHQSCLKGASRDREPCKALPSGRAEFKEIDYAAAHMPREEEVVSFAVGDGQGVEAGELPQIALRVLKVEQLLFKIRHHPKELT
jgi:hypothetical protein